LTPDQQFWLAVLAQVVALITGLAAVYLKVHDLSKQVNGRMTELVETTRRLGHAQGLSDAPGTDSGAAPPFPPAL
jgi:hypothetical protein